jgi:hypothetical protein
MTNNEAKKALDELIVFNGPLSKSDDNDHYFEVIDKIFDAEEEERKKKNGNP